MKKIILTFAIVVITTISLFAQEKTPARSPEEHTEKIVAKMKTDLALSDEQVNKLKPVILKREQQRQELRSTMGDVRERHKLMAKEAEEDFKNILTPDQMEKLKQQRKEMREKRLHKQQELHHD